MEFPYSPLQVRRHLTYTAALDSAGTSQLSNSATAPTMISILLRDAEVTNKLLEAILESPGGRRSLSRFARTCRAISEPALNLLWKELDSIAPIIGLFPASLLKKARRPGLGLTRLPREEDWATIIKYSRRIRRIVYDESANNISPSILSMLEECRPKSHILPQLQELTWKVDTAAALQHCSMFLCPGLQYINLEVGTRFKQLNDFLADMSSRVMLKGFSFISPTALPDSFTELLLRQKKLEKVALVAPGALSPGVGRWLAALPHLKMLQLDLTGRAPIAVEGFFDELMPRSGDSTPSSIGSRDSGVFSGEELDFTEIRKSALRLTGDYHPKGSFARLKKIQLSGEVANIFVFLKHIESHIASLDLVIEDPPDNADWQDLSGLICEKFADTLQSMKITATPSSKFVDLVRSTPRAEPPTGRLSLEQLTALPKLSRLDIDLPESVVFIPADIEALARACPNLEILRLCPWSRFPLPHNPKLTIDSLAPLIKHCRRLNTLAVVFNANASSAARVQTLLRSQDYISPSILRFHVGHSSIADSFQASILISHLMPRMEGLKWFQERTRVGFVEAHAKGWQAVSETLPHLQMIRIIEKTFAAAPPPPKPETAEKSIDATVSTKSRSVSAVVQTEEFSVQASPVLVSCAVDACVGTSEMSIDATPKFHEMSIEAIPMTASTSTSTETLVVTGEPKHLALRMYPTVYLISAIMSLFNFAYRCTLPPINFSSRIIHLAKHRFSSSSSQKSNGSLEPKPEIPSTPVDTIPLDDLPVRQ